MYFPATVIFDMYFLYEEAEPRRARREAGISMFGTCFQKKTCISPTTVILMLLLYLKRLNRRARRGAGTSFSERRSVFKHIKSTQQL